MTRDQLEKGIEIRGKLDKVDRALRAIQDIKLENAVLQDCISENRFFLKICGDEKAEDIIRNLTNILTSQKVALEKQLAQL